MQVVYLLLNKFGLQKAEIIHVEYRLIVIQ